MSLLSGMNDMLKNNAALEAAMDEILFEEEIAMEADELIDTMVDKKAPFSDDIDEMEKEDEDEDELNEELDSEDNSIASASKATEAAALTGTSFLQSLIMDNDDPITTKNGSIGSQDGTANYDRNYSAEYDDNNDPITTKKGSIGYQQSGATHDKNYSDEYDDNNDPITTFKGSVGQKNSTANPTVPVSTKESMEFFSELLGIDYAMENAKFVGEDLDGDDPITTQNGSIGQRTSAANHKENYADGNLDDNDPVKTNDGSEGQQDSSANYDKNYSDGDLDDDDPITTDEGKSVGQRDSSANPRTADESFVDDELDALNDLLYSSDFDDLDDM